MKEKNKISNQLPVISYQNCDLWIVDTAQKREM